MTAPYVRTKAMQQFDHMASKEFEGIVQGHLPDYTISYTNSTTELDWEIPGVRVECKEKRQPLTPRWHLLSGVEEKDLAVLDELSLRKALVHAPHSYFLFRDLPGGDRLFVASSMEVAVAEKARRNRVGKGKLILDLTTFRQLEGLEDLMPTIWSDVKGAAWKQSGCMSQKEVLQV